MVTRIWRWAFATYVVWSVHRACGPDGRNLALESGAGGSASRSSGIHADLQPLSDPLAGSSGNGTVVEMPFVLDGTRSLTIAPIADNNDIALRSAWPHPSFGGRFLPNAPTISERGFDASWSLSSLATGAQTQLPSSQTGLDMLEVRLVDPVHVHTQADRASKYVILFVVLTFVAFRVDQALADPSLAIFAGGLGAGALLPAAAPFRAHRVLAGVSGVGCGVYRFAGLLYCSACCAAGRVQWGSR